MTARPTRVMISCGEASGDLYAAALVGALRLREPAIDIIGFGGERLEAAGARLIGNFHGLSVTGLTEALRVVPRSFAMLRRLTDAAREFAPDVFVAIDFPDFNFRLMAAMRRLGIPVVYYISPQLWAWRAGRMAAMKQHVDRVLVIFPFEEALYRDAGIPVEFVGHPLVDLTQVQQSREDVLREHGLDPRVPTVALLPGSRVNEVARIAPTIANALPLIAARVPNVQFVVAAAPSLSESLFAPLIGTGNGPPEGGPHRSDASPHESEATVAAAFRHPARSDASPHESEATVGAAFRRPAIIRGRTDDVLAACDVAITASGTATVQCALHERPMVVVYRLSSLTYRVGKPFVKVDTYAMANLIAGRRIVPELIQDGFTPERTAEEVVSFLTDRARYQQTRDALREVRTRLGESGASGRAADSILQVAHGGAKSA